MSGCQVFCIPFSSGKGMPVMRSLCKLSSFVAEDEIQTCVILPIFHAMLLPNEAVALLPLTKSFASCVERVACFRFVSSFRARVLGEKNSVEHLRMCDRVLVVEIFSICRMKLVMLQATNSTVIRGEFEGRLLHMSACYRKAQAALSCCLCVCAPSHNVFLAHHNCGTLFSSQILA